MTCERMNQIHAYHDGELSPAARGEVESHVAVCAECRQLLGELRDLSQMLATVDLPAVPRGALNRMHGAWWATKPAQEQGVRRLAGWLTAVAAAVLVIVPLSSRPTPTVGPSVVPVRSFEIMALVPPAGPPDDANAELVAVAQWFATDLSTTEQGP